MVQLGSLSLSKGAAIHRFCAHSAAIFLRLTM